MTDARLNELYKQIYELEKKEDWLAQVPLFEEALAISRELYGEYHDETLRLYIELGGLLRNLGRYEKALSMLQKALMCARKLKGVNHPDYAAALVNIANLFRMMNLLEESERYFLEAKRIFEITIGTKVFTYIGLCNNLGLLYQQMKRYDDAIRLHKYCLQLLSEDPNREVVYGVTLNNLVESYKLTGQKEQAILYLNQAIEIFKKYPGQVTLYAAGMNNLGAIYYEDHNYEKALECFKIALDISREKLGTESESYQNSLTNYKMTLSKLSLVNKDVAYGPADHVYNITEQSKGLDLAEAYFFDVCYPRLQKELSAYLPRMAAGLVGEGSECYGFDDMVSRDHDFGPSFQIYIPAEDIPVYGKKLRALVNNLPSEYAGFGARNTSTYGGGRIGLFSIEDFYDKFLSIHEVPTSNSIWMQLSDIPLSTATNGRVFMDNLGTFTSIREGLLKHYPKDVQLKKLSIECMQVAQSGQYNLARSLKRGQYVAAHHALDEFIEHYSSIIYLLNKTYKPYYKWEHEGLKKLPVLGMTSHRLLQQIVSLSFTDQADQIIFQVESLCQKVIEVFQNRGLSSSRSDFLLHHGPELLTHITDPKLKNSNPWI